MCLTINKTIHPSFKPLIAKKDIYTLKIAEIFDSFRCISFFQKQVQKYNVLLKFNIGIPYSWVNSKAIDAGLHSVISPENNFIFTFDASQVSREIILCKIPKGSKYYIGVNGDIVSNQLILLKPIVRNNSCRIPLDTKINNSRVLQILNKKGWRECFKIAKDLDYKIGL